MTIVWCVAALPDGVHFVVGLRQRRGPAVPRRRTLVHTFKGHTSDVMRGGGDARRPAHHQRLGRSALVKVWSVASKSLVSTCVGHAGYVRAVAAMPDGQRILSGWDDGEVRVWLLDGTLENTFSGLHVRYVVAHASWRCPTTSTRSPARMRLRRQALQRQRRRRPAHLQHHTRAVTSWRCCPTAAASSAARTTWTACVVEHGLAPQTLQ